MSALLDNGIEVPALHNFFERPRLFYMHVYGHGDPLGLAPRGQARTANGASDRIIEVFKQVVGNVDQHEGHTRARPIRMAQERVAAIRAVSSDVVSESTPLHGSPWCDIVGLVFSEEVFAK
jgi:hypothetical protein